MKQEMFFIYNSPWVYFQLTARRSKLPHNLLFGILQTIPWVSLCCLFFGLNIKIKIINPCHESFVCLEFMFFIFVTYIQNDINNHVNSRKDVTSQNGRQTLKCGRRISFQNETCFALLIALWIDKNCLNLFDVWKKLLLGSLFLNNLVYQSVYCILKKRTWRLRTSTSKISKGKCEEFLTPRTAFKAFRCGQYITNQMQSK